MRRKVERQEQRKDKALASFFLGPLKLYLARWRGGVTWSWTLLPLPPVRLLEVQPVKCNMPTNALPLLFFVVQEEPLLATLNIATGCLTDSFTFSGLPSLYTSGMTNNLGRSLLPFALGMREANPTLTFVQTDHCLLSKHTHLQTCCWRDEVKKSTTLLVLHRSQPHWQCTSTHTGGCRAWPPEGLRLGF